MQQGCAYQWLAPRFQYLHRQEVPIPENLGEVEVEVHVPVVAESECFQAVIRDLQRRDQRWRKGERARKTGIDRREDVDEISIARANWHGDDRFSSSVDLSADHDSAAASEVPIVPLLR